MPPVISEQTIRALISVFHDIEICDGCGQEIEVISDGYMAYAGCGDALELWKRPAEARSFYRDGTLLVANCGRMLRGDEECSGSAGFRLDQPGRWRAVTDEDRRILTHSLRVEFW